MTRSPQHERLQSLVEALVGNEQLALTPGTTTSRLALAFEAGGDATASLLNDGEALMNWLIHRPEVEDLFITDVDFVRAVVRSHPAAPTIDGEERPAFVGMVTRAYDLLAWLCEEAAAGRRFAIIELASPLLYARSATMMDALLDDEAPLDVYVADLDPLNLGESGPSALNPSLHEMLRVLGFALEQPGTGPSIRAALANSKLSLTLVCNKSASAVLDLEEPLDARKVAPHDFCMAALRTFDGESKPRGVFRGRTILRALETDTHSKYLRATARAPERAGGRDRPRGNCARHPGARRQHGCRRRRCGRSFAREKRPVRRASPRHHWARFRA